MNADLDRSKIMHELGRIEGIAERISWEEAHLEKDIEAIKEAVERISKCLDNYKLQPYEHEPK